MPPARRYSTPERLARIRASKREWSKRNLSYRRQKNREYTQRPGYAEQRRRWYENWKRRHLENRGPPKRRGPPSKYACEEDRIIAHRAASAAAMRRYRAARFKDSKRLAERFSQLNALDDATVVALEARAVPGSVAAEADHCMFVVPAPGNDAGEGFLVCSQDGVVRQLQPLAEAVRSLDEPEILH